MTLTYDEKQWLLLKVSKALYATQQQIDILERGSGFGYIPEEKVSQATKARAEKEMLGDLFEKISKEYTI